LDEIDRVFVVGAGKAVVPMARVVERLLGERLAGGLVVAKEGFAEPLDRVVVREASHPTPDERGAEAAREIERIAESAGAKDLFLVLITGGASALLPAPIDGVSLERKRAVTEALLKSGADIRELNSARKALSRLKGGGLAAVASPARVLSLIVSDVVGDPVDVIGSGPTARDDSDEAIAVFEKYDLMSELPPNARVATERPRKKTRTDGIVENVVVANNELAAEAMAKEAERRGYATIIRDTPLEGEARASGKAFVREGAGRAKGERFCYVAGGETTVTVRGDGDGGRATEFCLGAAESLSKIDGSTLLCAGTDGDDGTSGAAGAIVDSRTKTRAAKEGMDWRRYLAKNDSASFFRALDDLVVTGATGTNVADVAAFLRRDDAD
jgi:hydroxypyruvate reductase